MSDKLDPQGVQHETNFWKGFVKSQRFLGWIADAPTPELDPRVRDFLQQEEPERILDVGSGPVSLLRGAVAGSTITTCDPLSAQYQTMLDFAGLGIKPPEPFAAEELPAEWDEQFDCVAISNAIDHAFNPLAGLKRLAACVKPGGTLIVQGHVNEADYEKRAGFHQFNTCMDGCYFSVSGANLNEVVAAGDLGMELAWYDQSLNSNNREWLIWILRKPKT